MSDDISQELQKCASPKKAKILSGFFKTGKGEYGEGDKFIGVVVPEIRKISKKHLDLSLKEIEKHLHSKIHEERLVALLILVEKFKKADEKEKKEIFDFYLKNTKHTNNWDLIDLTAPSIVGAYLLNKDKKILYYMSTSESIWEKRIAIMSTFQFIKCSKFEDTFNI
jgi:3-methyladenine DNA glycosylase AlkD